MCNTSFKNIKLKIDDLNHRTRILAVSKNRSVDEVMSLYLEGQREFGESYLQESLPKISAMPLDIIWHFIGNIQRRKCNKIAANFDWVQSIDSLAIAQAINKSANNLDKNINICIQINIDMDEKKGGTTIDLLPELCSSISNSCSNLDLRGIMCILAKDQKLIHQQESFLKMSKIFGELQKIYGESFDTLSMGMSGDFEIALKSGSNMVRLGSCLFSCK